MSVARTHDLRVARHGHGFADAGRDGRARALGAVALLTLVTMAVELAAGWWSGSLALTADGWHMGTHALAIGGAWLAARWAARVEARDHAATDDGRYSFGGWKIEVLAAYTSGLSLLAVALWLVVDAVLRLLSPEPVAFGPALVVAVIGLVVNLASAAMLMRGSRASPAHAQDARPGGPEGEGHGHGHQHGHDHAHDHAHDHVHYHVHDHVHDRGHDRGHGRPHDHGDNAAHRHGHGRDQGDHHDDHAPSAWHGGHSHDHNFNAAYLHVVADALTSVLAIGALAGGALFGWLWLDAAVALVGAAVIGRWAVGVLGGSARALVDATADPALVARIRRAIESDGDTTVADLHVWQVGGRAWSAALAVVADEPLPAAAYRERLAGIAPLRHVTVEVHRCPGCDAAVPESTASSGPVRPDRT